MQLSPTNIQKYGGLLNRKEVWMWGRKQINRSLPPCCLREPNQDPQPIEEEKEGMTVRPSIQRSMDVTSIQAESILESSKKRRKLEAGH